MSAAVEWKTQSLRQLATINYGRSPAGILADDGEYPVVGTGGSERKGNDYLYDGDSIILGRKGTIDRVHFATGRFWTIDTAYYLSEFGESVPCWLYYFFQTLDLRQMNEATGVPSLSRELLYKIEIPTPSKPEQTQIAEILSTLDRAIEQTEALIAKQQRLKTGLMQDLLTRGIDPHGNLRSEHTHPFKDSPLGRIPVEWEVKLLGEIAEVKGGKRLPAGHSYSMSDTGHRYFRVTDFYQKEIDYFSLEMLEEATFKALQRYEIRRGDLCVSIAGSLGHFAHYLPPEGFSTILTENAARIVPVSRIAPALLCAMLNSDWVQIQIEEEKGVGGGVPKLALFRIKSLLVPFPACENEQSRILDSLTSQANALADTNLTLAKLRSLKTALMQDLLTGRKRVTVLLNETEVPA
jgi:type I restriction enzyme S subunit